MHSKNIIFTRFKKKFKYYRIITQRYIYAKLGATIHKLGILCIITSANFVRKINIRLYDTNSYWFIFNLSKLHKRIAIHLQDQRKHYPHYSYFYGYPYQSLATLMIYGDRPTEERFYTYELEKYLKADMSVLDVGCNCAFLDSYVAYRIGCKIYGIDINPYMIKIGNEVSQYLNVDTKVNLKKVDFKIFKNDMEYDAIFSFATHWTDDTLYRVNLTQHFERLASFLKKDGLILFESHTQENEKDGYKEAIYFLKKDFEILKYITVENGLREFIIFKKMDTIVKGETLDCNN